MASSAFCSQHYSSHISSRVSSSATGRRELSARVWACRMSRATSAGVGHLAVHYAESVEDSLSYKSALGLPRVALAHLTAIADEHEQGDAVELGQRHDAVDGGQQAVVLHQHGGLLARQVRPSGDADAFLFLVEADQG